LRRQRILPLLLLLLQRIILLLILQRVLLLLQRIIILLILLQRILLLLQRILTRSEFKMPCQELQTAHIRNTELYPFFGSDLCECSAFLPSSQTAAGIVIESPEVVTLI